MRLEVSRDIDAAPTAIWRLLTDWERQAEWMVDARQVEVLTPQREGVGVTIRCPTNVLGLTVQDVMRVTGWEPERRLAVIHLGDVITGGGAFELRPLPGGATRLVWWEEVDPPLGRLGERGATTLVRPLLARLFRRSLDNLAALVEGRG